MYNDRVKKVLEEKMSVRINTDFLAGFIRDDEINNLRPYLTAAHKLLLSGKVAWND